MKAIKNSIFTTTYINLTDNIMYQIYSISCTILKKHTKLKYLVEVHKIPNIQHHEVMQYLKKTERKMLLHQ